MKGQHSETKPQNKADHELSIKHLKRRVAFNKQNTKDHKALMKNGGSRKYNVDHIDHHEDQVKHDEKLIKERQKSMKKAEKDRDKRPVGKRSGESVKRQYGIK